MARATRARASGSGSQSQIIRYQSQAQASQSRRTQSRRGRGQQVADVGDEDDEEEGGREESGDERGIDGMDIDDEDYGEGTGVQDGEQELDRKANDLVRLALFNEQRRTPLRRDEISKKVMGSGTRAFPFVFGKAQKILNKVFGMELVELRSRAEHGEGAASQAMAQDDAELEEARRATGVRKRAAATGTRTYILRSILDPAIIERAVQPNAKILEEELSVAPPSSGAPGDEDTDGGEDDSDDGIEYSCGSIISWSTSDQLGHTALLYVVLSLILVSGRVLSDMDLRVYLKRLHTPVKSFLSFTTHSTHRSMSVDQYLSQLIRQGYLDQQRIGESNKKGRKGKGKRGSATQADGDDGTMIWEWRWGPRAHAEVGEVEMGKFVAEFMVGGRGEGEDGDPDAEDRRDDEESLKRMMKSVERAAGGALEEVK